MFDFVDVSESGILCLNILYYRENRNHEWNNLFIYEETKRDILICYSILM